ncbi:hypothetical protein ACTJKN_20795 [Pedobacter sp. 22163]
MKAIKTTTKITARTVFFFKKAKDTAPSTTPTEPTLTMMTTSVSGIL